MYTLISIILAIAATVIPGIALWQRSGQGIGWQFIRFVVIASALPITGILALNGVLNEAAAAILAGAFGYVFGQAAGGIQDNKQPSTSAATP
jgi:hypothetical protein